MSEHQFTMRIYIEDTDAAGIVYHANYLSYFSRARSEWLREHNIDLSRLKESKLLFPVCTAEIAYKRPLLLDDEVVILSKVIETKKCSISFLQKIYRRNDLHNLICEAKIKVACVDETLRPQSIPDTILEIVKNRSSSG